MIATRSLRLAATRFKEALIDSSHRRRPVSSALNFLDSGLRRNDNSGINQLPLNAHRRAADRPPAARAPIAAPLAPLVTLAAIALPALLLLPAWYLKHPLLYALRHLETPLLIGIPVFALLRWRRFLPALSRAVLLAVLLLTVWREVDYRLQREAVLAAGPAMQAVGQHFIVGYSDFDEIRQLTASGLIGGIYLARRNLRGRSFAQVAGEIAELQAIRRRAELPPLIVAADQEGGAVSHLSPLLEALPPLSTLANSQDPAGAARAYGQRQGRQLAALGVNLNFGPVVDLRPAGGGEDRLSNIAARAIASEPGRVVEIAGAYLDGLNDHGVRGTLKHFPGLGRVRGDTHLHPARLAASPDELATDWQPFRQLASHPGAAIMLGHVTLTALDPERAASHSPAIIDGLLRERWGYDGLLVTDDLNMGAVYNLGIGRVAGEALAAGADLVLVSYDPRQVVRAIFGAAQALERREIAPATLAESERRIAGFHTTIP